MGAGGSGAIVVVVEGIDVLLFVLGVAPFEFDNLEDDVECDNTGVVVGILAAAVSGVVVGISARFGAVESSSKHNTYHRERKERKKRKTKGEYSPVCQKEETKR